MRCMIFVRATKASEAGTPPSAEMMSVMGKYNEELIKAGVLLDAGGLKPSSKSARVKFSGTKRWVVDGPFAEAKELVAGYWMLQVKSLDEAIEWVKRCPNPFPEGDSEIEIRPLFEAGDFPDLPEEVRLSEEAFARSKK
jgi:hypothetical protein